MIKLMFKLLSVVIIAGVALLAGVEVFPEQLRTAEEKVWISVVTPIQEFVAEMKSKLDTARDADYQRDIEDIVNNEIVE